MVRQVTVKERKMNVQEGGSKPTLEEVLGEDVEDPRTGLHGPWKGERVVNGPRGSRPNQEGVEIDS